MTTYIGKPVPRIDGYAKVTGAATYAAEYNVPRLTYGYVVSATITKGRISTIDSSAALALEGVLQVFTHENRPDLPWFDRHYKDQVSVPGSPFRPLYDSKIFYNGQPIALVVAESFEVARYAASLVIVTYEVQPHQTNLGIERDKSYEPKKKRQLVPPPAKPRGDIEKGLAEADVQHQAEYLHHFQHHNPMEMHASTVVWEADGTLTVYDKTQGVQNSQSYIASVFGLDKDKVRVMSPYVGGGFGSGLRPQYQLFLAVLAATALKRSVRVVLTRQQMFTFGYRPDTIQEITLGATRDGTLTAIRHAAISNTSHFEEYQEDVVNWAGLLYACENTKFTYELAKLDLYTPIDMRAPGGATGMYALECAMDELAVALQLDPIELRLKNYSEKDQNNNKPYSSKALRECYEQGAERFGWQQRSPAPRSMRDGKELVGWGMATGIWQAQQGPIGIKATLSIDGSLEITTAASDIGTGTYTIIAQVAADTLGVPLDEITVKLGDSALPFAPPQGGSWMAATAASGVYAVCESLRNDLWKLAKKVKNSPFARALRKSVLFTNGCLTLRANPKVAMSISDIMQQSETHVLVAEKKHMPNFLNAARYSAYTHSAIFVEVKVDEELGKVRVTRVVNAVAAGRILNATTARSQILGGVVWGISMALEEDTLLDHTYGRFMNQNLAEYHVPVNADIYDIEVLFVEEPDDHINTLGIKGIGEIGIVGTPAAVANAIYHATGKRVRELPITLDKLL